MFSVVVLIVQFYITTILCASRNTPCITPNQERARCIPVSNCNLILKIIQSGDIEAISFAKQSQCGYETEPLVCCGTLGVPKVNVNKQDPPKQRDSRNEPCVTPKREDGKCIPVLSCPEVLNALKSGTSEAVNFAQKSQCGYDSGPLVCCASKDESQDIFEHRLLPNQAICGLEKSNDRIIGGTATDIDEFPWLALLRYSDTTFGEDAGFKCGGSLINRRYVLTAAHCISLGSNQRLSLSGVRLGEWRQSTSQDCVGKKGLQKCSDPPVDVGIQNSIPHPRYNTKTRDNDIGLIRLQRNINYNDFIYPVCIPPPNRILPNIGTSLVVAGWGATETNDTSDIKQKAAVPLVSSVDCSRKFGRRGYISDNQFCAGGVEGKDSCQGDSGGPIMRYVLRNFDIQWIQEGVISWGVSCGLANYPGVYTRVSRYSNWIVENMSNF